VNIERVNTCDTDFSFIFGQLRYFRHKYKLSAFINLKVTKEEKCHYGPQIPTPDTGWGQKLHGRTEVNCSKWK